jgi:hypothetical protein
MADELGVGCAPGQYLAQQAEVQACGLARHFLSLGTGIARPDPVAGLDQVRAYRSAHPPSPASPISGIDPLPGIAADAAAYPAAGTAMPLRGRNLSPSAPRRVPGRWC